ncbi:hypothetical protein PMAYCL1PPCAC_00672, partial [Pristionchus mayeri]
QLWPSIRWIAYAYFKSFFLVKSGIEYSPKVVMTACYYLATKIDEFYVPVDEFVENLRSGTREQNTARILALEPEIHRVLKYQLTIHCPFRPFEGHLMEMKRTLLILNFDIETLRPAANQFMRETLLGETMLLYAPTQISLAAIKHALASNAKSPEVLRDFVQKLLGVDDANASDSRSASGADAAAAVEKLMTRLEQICECVRSGVAAVPSPPEQQTLQVR